MPSSHSIKSSAMARPSHHRTFGLLGIAAVMATSILLAGCNTTAGVGKDVSATGAAVTRGATEVKSGL